MLFDQGVCGVVRAAVRPERMLTLGGSSGRRQVGQWPAESARSSAPDAARATRSRLRLSRPGSIRAAQTPRAHRRRSRRQVRIDSLHRSGHAHHEFAYLLVIGTSRTPVFDPAPSEICGLLQPGRRIFGRTALVGDGTNSCSSRTTEAVAAAIASSEPLRSFRSDLILAASSVLRILIALAACSNGVTPKTSAR